MHDARAKSGAVSRRRSPGRRVDREGRVIVDRVILDISEHFHRPPGQCPDQLSRRGEGWEYNLWVWGSGVIPLGVQHRIVGAGSHEALHFGKDRLTRSHIHIRDG